MAKYLDKAGAQRLVTKMKQLATATDQQLLDDIDQLSETVGSISTTLANVKQTVEQGAEGRSLFQAIEDNSDEISAIKQTLNTGAYDGGSLTEQIEYNRTDINTLEGDVSTLQSAVAALEAAVPTAITDDEIDAMFNS